MSGHRGSRAVRTGILLVAACLMASAQGRAPRTIVFVCEHGAARSVIAAAYFNKLAAERHLDFHAVARGATPQPDLSVATVQGLEKDGVAFPAEKPRPLTRADVRGAVRVVAFCPLPAFAKQARADAYEVPAPSDGYDASRDAILVHVRALIDELAGSRSR